MAIDRDAPIGVIRFTVSENDSMMSRETEIAVVYSGDDKQQTIIVKQSALSGIAFEFLNKKIESTSISMDIKPLDITTAAAPLA